MRFAGCKTSPLRASPDDGHLSVFQITVNDLAPFSIYSAGVYYVAATHYVAASIRSLLSDFILKPVYLPSHSSCRRVRAAAGVAVGSYCGV